MEVGHGQDRLLASFHPAQRGEALAPGTVPVEAGVVGRTLEAALVARAEVTAEGWRAKSQDRIEGPRLLAGEDTSLAEALPEGAEDIGDLEARPVRKLAPTDGAAVALHGASAQDLTFWN